MADLLGARRDERDIGGVIELHRWRWSTPEVCDKARQAFDVEHARAGRARQERHAEFAIVTADQVGDVVCGMNVMHASIADRLR